MSKRSVMLLREFMTSQANHWIFLPLVLVFASVGNLSAPALLGWIIVSFFPLLLFVLREIVQSTILQLCCFPIFLGIITVLPIELDIIKGIYFFFSMVYILLSLFMTLRNNHMTKILPPFFSLGINFFTAVFLFPNKEIYHYPFILFVSMIFSVVFFFFAFYVDQYLIFVFRNEETSNSMPRDKILDSGMRLSGMYLGIGAIVLFIISAFALSDEFIHDFWRKVKMHLRNLIRYLLGLMKNQNSDGVMLSDKTGGMGLKLPEVADQAPSLFEKIMELLIFILAVLVLFAFLITIFLKIIKLLQRLFPKKSVILPDEEVENIDKHENIGRKKKVYRDEEDDPNLSIKLHIRKIYKKKALATEKSREELTFSTAREVGLLTKNPTLSCIYEKARYSNLACEKEDLKKLQKSFSQKNQD